MAQKVGILCSSDSWGGLELNVLRLASWLQAAGMPLVCMLPPDVPMHSRALAMGLPVVAIRRQRKYLDFRNAARLADLVKEQEVDIILFSATRDFSLCVLCKSWMQNQLKLIYMQQMQISFTKKGIIHTLRYARIDAWVAPLQLLRDQVLRYTNMAADHIHIIPLGVDVEALQAALVPQGEARAYFGLPQQEPVLGIMGRFDPQKGQLFLVEALAELNRMGQPCHLLMVGDPTVNEGQAYHDQVMATVAEMNLSDRVVVHGFMDNIGLFFSAITVFALASQGETYGMVTLEAMASGLPVIATNTGGTPELLGHGQYGQLYEPGNLAQFCQGVRQLLGQQQGQPALGQQAAQHAQQHYHYRIQVARIMELIAKLRNSEA